MLFNSLSFAVFFPAIVITYFLLPARYRVFFLLVASCFFYASYVPEYLLILFAVITTDFFLAQLLVRFEGRRRLVFLWASIAANLGFLFVFKYFNFFNENLAALANFLNWNYSYEFLALALPIGLSFHIFQSLSYVIEVYKKRFEPETNYLRYALYVMFFPQLVAGPIERPAHLLPQMRIAHLWDSARATQGLERMLWGFFKKLVIADNLAPIVDALFAAPEPNGPMVILAIILFAYQLYCDFSGYADIAIGAANVLGYDLVENFDRPFASRSVAEFWRRWHISLSSWLRDYVYYPLTFAGKRITPLRIHMSTFITFVLIGLWHGANWTFVALGALHGLYLVFGTITQKGRTRVAEMTGITRLPRIYGAWQVVVTFLLTGIGWIFFRAPNMDVAFTMLSNIGTEIWRIADPLYLRYELFTHATLGVPKVMMLVIACAITVMEVVQYRNARSKTPYVLDLGSGALRLACWYALILATLLFGHFAAQPFIYFQF